MECAETNCGTVGGHCKLCNNEFTLRGLPAYEYSIITAWISTEIILDVADPTYINTLYKTAGVTGDMTTSDGGTTWVVTTINIPQFTF